MTLDHATAHALRLVSTATLTTVLLKKGIRRCWMKGPMPFFNADGQRLVGRAFTLRFVPAREDLATPESWSSPRSTRAAIEDMPEGCIAVVDAMGVAGRRHLRRHSHGPHAQEGRDGTRHRRRRARRRRGRECRAAGLVQRASPRRPPSRDSPSSAGRSPSAAAASRCFPDDVLVADGDGVVVIPQALVADVTAAAVEQERLEAWIMKEVEKGVPLPGLYPPNAETKARYEAERGQV